MQSRECVSGPQISIRFKRCRGDRPDLYALSDCVRMSEFEPPLGIASVFTEQKTFKSLDLCRKMFVFLPITESSGLHPDGVGKFFRAPLAPCLVNFSASTRATQQMPVEQLPKAPLGAVGGMSFARPSENYHSLFRISHEQQIISAIWCL